jgi:proteasome lid subunit RPN8/RPN11
MALKIPVELYDQLRQHGEATYPHECCGVLVGEFDEAGEKVVRAVVQCGNTRTDSPQNRYHISPLELVRIQREALLAGHDIVGFYHSHPDHPAHWSSTDLAEAHWTGSSYVITSVENGRAVLTNSFILLDREEAKHFEDELLEVIEHQPMYCRTKPI